MTEGPQTETVIARIARVIAETGPLGLIIRGAGRMMFAASNVLDAAGCRVLASTPPVLLTRWSDRPKLRRNEELAGRHAGKRCFILGNGPTLREEDVSVLEGEILITVNLGHRFARSHGLTPAYHAAIDPYFIDPVHDEVLEDWVNFQKQTGASLLLSTELANRFGELGLECKHYAVKQFLKSTYFDRIGTFVPTDLSLAQPGYLSVIHFAIVAAIYMECSEIYLLGCDMDFFIHPDATFMHSYEADEEGKATAVELFGWDQVDLMAWCLDEFRAFRQLGRLAEAKGSKVVNAGRDGALNVFPRKPLRSLPDTRCH